MVFSVLLWCDAEGVPAASAGVVCTCFKFNSVNCTSSPELSLLLGVRLLYEHSPYQYRYGSKALFVRKRRAMRSDVVWCDLHELDGPVRASDRRIACVFPFFGTRSTIYMCTCSVYNVFMFCAVSTLRPDPPPYSCRRCSHRHPCAPSCYAVVPAHAAHHHAHRVLS